METVDGITPELAKIFAGKEQRRRTLAGLAYPEKVQVVMQLQEMAAAILRARGKSAQPWRTNRSAD
jgi:hypothetical protein